MKANTTCKHCHKDAWACFTSVHCVSPHCRNYDPEVMPTDLGVLVDWATRPDAPWRREQQKIQDEFVEGTRKADDAPAFHVGQRVRYTGASSVLHDLLGTVSNMAETARAMKFYVEFDATECKTKHGLWLIASVLEPAAAAVESKFRVGDRVVFDKHDGECLSGEITGFGLKKKEGQVYRIQTDTDGKWFRLEKRLRHAD